MEGLCVPGVTREVGVAILYLSRRFGCTDLVQVLLHVVCHCEDDQLSVLSPCIAVLGVSQYGHCNLFTQMSREPGYHSIGVFQSQ